MPAETALAGGRSLWRRATSRLPILLLALWSMAGCERRTVVCENPSFYQLARAPGASAPEPFASAPTGPAVTARDIQDYPERIAIDESRRVRVWFTAFGHMGTMVELSHLPEEEKALSVTDPSLVYRMAQLSSGGADVVRFGFKSPLCVRRGPDTLPCEYGQDEVPLVAMMNCKTVRTRPRWSRQLLPGP